jgi:predicted metal-binding membrane protein
MGLTSTPRKSSWTAADFALMFAMWWVMDDGGDDAAQRLALAAIAGLVFVEKLFPAGQWIARASGVLMIAFGGYLLVSA